MNGKEKFMFVMLLALYIGAFYYYAMTEELKIRMDELNLGLIHPFLFLILQSLRNSRRHLYIEPRALQT